MSWCWGLYFGPQVKLREINQRIRRIKERNGVSPTMELKWTKISPAKIDLYKDIVNYFFDDDDLHFRAVIVPEQIQIGPCTIPSEP